MDKSSLYREAYHESQRYREALEQRLGNDFGEAAPMEWNRDHWWRWAADRAVQHITGERFWVELDSKSFASVTRETPERLRTLQQLRELQHRFNDDSLGDFKEKESLRAQWSQLLNGLLDPP